MVEYDDHSVVEVEKVGGDTTLLGVWFDEWGAMNVGFEEWGD